MISTFAVLTTVEVLKIANRYRSTTVDLPELLQSYSATVYGDQLYMLGGQVRPGLPANILGCLE